MSILKRLGKIKTLIEKVGGTVNGRKKLHKLVYLLQHSGDNLGYRFVFHNYGVFSPLLANDLDMGSSMNAIEQKIIPGSNAYKISLSETASKMIINDDLSSKSEEIIEVLKNKEPQLLEALSTIVYLNSNYYQGTRLRKKLEELKPNLASQYDEAFELANRLFDVETN